MLEVREVLLACESDILIQICLPFLANFFAISAGGIAYSNAFFGAGTGPIYLDDVACTLSANKLLECFSSPILVHNCLHSDDAGVRCEGKKIHSLLICSNSTSFFL